MRIFTLAIFLLCAFSSSSQSLELPVQFIDHEFSNGDYAVTNISDQTVDIGMMMEKRCYNPADTVEVQACMLVCQEWTTDDFSIYPLPSITLEPGESYDLLSFHSETGEAGLQYPMIWRLYYYVIGDVQDKVWLEISLGDPVCPESDMVVGIEEEIVSLSSVYPNPSNGAIKVRNATPGVCNYVIRDLRGQVVFQSRELAPGESRLNLSVNPGIYLGQLVNAQGVVVKTMRHVIQ